MHRTDHRHVGIVLDNLSKFLFMTAAANLVKNHSGNTDIRIERLVSENERELYPGSCRVRLLPGLPEPAA